MLFRPCIDLHDGVVKQIVGGSLTDDTDKTPETNFVAEQPPAFFAGLYATDQLQGGHVIKLGAGNDQAAKEALAAYPQGLQIGGGITNKNAREWLDAGAAQVIVTSYIFSDGELKWDNLKKLVELVGADHLVLDLSCRKKDGRYYIVTDRWQKFTTVEVNAQTMQELAKYCCEFLIHAVDVEGKQAGIDTELIALMAEHSPVPTVYAGGITSFEHIQTIRDVGKKRMGYTIGSALDIFGGQHLKYADVVEFERSQS